MFIFLLNLYINNYIGRQVSFFICFYENRTKLRINVSVYGFTLSNIYFEVWAVEFVHLIEKMSAYFINIFKEHLMNFFLCYKCHKYLILRLLYNFLNYETIIFESNFYQNTIYIS